MQSAFFSTSRQLPILIFFAATFRKISPGRSRKKYIVLGLEALRWNANRCNVVFSTSRVREAGQRHAALKETARRSGNKNALHPPLLERPIPTPPEPKQEPRNYELSQLTSITWPQPESCLRSCRTSPTLVSTRTQRRLPRRRP